VQVLDRQSTKSARVTARVVSSHAVSQRAGGDDALRERVTATLPNLQQSLLECAPGRTAHRTTASDEQVLFVLAGRGRIHAGGSAHELGPDTGVYLPPGESYQLEVDGPEPLRVVSVRIPEPAEGPPGPAQTVDVCDLEREQATTDRTFSVLADPSTGLRSATHFVGYVPTEKAPDHFHIYDEVIYIVDGVGVFHAHGEHSELGPGSCIALPARTVHCLENTGSQTMRLVAVFRPGGSPAAAYYPDGTPAYEGTQPLPDTE
jgi:mannose-6-phosphate isomerase-like protein (cupin superfamily)